MKNKYDCIIVGGGASGMMAAISSLESGRKVLLIEKNEKCGKKIYITGKGRCNVTNNRDISEFFDYVIRNRNFMYSAFYTFDNNALLEMLKRGGLKTKVERGERVFPVSDKASDVTKALLKLMNSFKGFDMMLNTEVKDIIVEEGAVKGVILTDGREIFSGNIILATGGMTYPVTGSDGFGYRMAEKYGHKVTDLSPALVQIESSDKWVKKLAGISIRNMEATLLYRGKRKAAQFGEMLFTHRGVSGPVMLYLSSFIDPSLSDNYKIKIDFKPALSEKKLDLRLLRDFSESPNKSAKTSLDRLLPKAVARELFIKSGIDPEKRINAVTKEERRILVNLLKGTVINVSGLGDFSEAIITSGGVDVKEINPSTMESRNVKGLFFTGEVIDVNALTGGYNLQIAFSTGYLAGKNIR